MYKLMNAKQRFCARLMSNGTPRDVLAAHCGGKEIIVELGLAAIAVGLLLMFRTQIGDLIKTLMGTSKTSITGMFTEVGKAA